MKFGKPLNLREALNCKVKHTKKMPTAEISALISEVCHGSHWISTFRHPNSLRELTSTFTPDDFQLCVSLAASAVDTLKKQVNSEQYRENLAREIKRQADAFDAEKKQIQDRVEHQHKISESKHRLAQEQLEEEIKELQNQLKQLKGSLSLSETAERKMKEQLDKFTTLSESIQKKALQTVVEEKDAQHAKELDRLQALHQSVLHSLEKSATDRVAQCDTQHKEAMDAMRKLYTDQEAKIRKELEKKAGSSDKGKQGELEFEELATQYTKWPKLQNTSKTAHSTDRSCKIRSCETLFEIKNYTVDIPSKEVQKFQRDMEEHADCPFGVFVSLHTPIQGKRSGNFISYEWTSKSQLLLYISSFYTHPAEDLLAFIDLCADLAWSMFKIQSEKPTESDSVLQMRDRLEQARVIVEKEIKRLTEFTQTLLLDKRMLLESINKQHTGYSMYVKQSRATLGLLLETLIGSVLEEDGEPEKSEEKSVPVEVEEKPKGPGRPKGSKNKK